MLPKARPINFISSYSKGDYFVPFPDEPDTLGGKSTQIGHCQWNVNLSTDDNFSLEHQQVLTPEAKPLEDWPTPNKYYSEIASEVGNLK